MFRILFFTALLFSFANPILAADKADKKTVKRLIAKIEKFEKENPEQVSGGIENFKQSIKDHPEKAKEMEAIWDQMAKIVQEGKKAKKAK